MILVDTSVWVDHLRSGDARLVELLREGRVLAHPFVVGELACGSLRNREEILGLLATLPMAVIAGHDEALACLLDRKLYGTGLGWIDLHLLASAVLTRCRLWTREKALRSAAHRLAVSS